MLDYGLSNQQLDVICALSNGATVTDAAEQAGVHRNTINYWRRNLLPFQYALAEAQYDRALSFREKIEERVDTALATIDAILADPAAPASVRLKAALYVLQTASTAPLPKKQVQLDIEKIVVHQNPPAQNPPVNVTEDQLDPEPPVHKNAQCEQTTRREAPKIGRNEACPCGSGLKYKRCCLNHPQAKAA